MTQHLYLGLESINLTAPQRQTLVAALRALGKQSDPSPAKINHMRARLDGLALILEAEFQDAEITASAFAGYIAAVFGVDPALVSAATTQTAYGPLVTLTYLAQPRLRGILFGGATPTWEESRLAAVSYLAANSAAWESAA